MEPKIVKNMCAQGDVLVRRVDSIPEGYTAQTPKENNQHIIAFSETSHHHVVDATGTMLFEGGDPLVAYLRLDTVAETDMVHLRSHDTHGTVRLAGGKGAIYEVRRQREFDGQEARRAAD